MKYRWQLLTLLGLGMVVRVFYVGAQAATDPAYSQPLLDGEYYLAIARSIATGTPSPEAGAYYLAPLYSRMLAPWVLLTRESFTALYLAQQATMVGAVGLLAAVARRAAGDRAGLATAALALLYHPCLFFPSRPLGETLSILLLTLSLWLVGRSTGAALAGAGFVAGLASLARPNLLLVPVAWAVRQGVSRRWTWALATAVGLALSLAPSALRNAVVSGHLVPISSNGGITLFHGNGPGAIGTFTKPAGLSGRVADQRSEATAVARARTGLPLDDVEADSWWGREAIRARLDDPGGTVRLVGRKFLLLFDDAEHGLDYAPGLDENPWRRAAPVSFAVILGLAAVGLWLTGLDGTGGAPLWLAAATTAVAPVAFFTASRYRLPLATLLCVPAGVGLAALLEGLKGRPRRRATLGVASGLLVAALSWLVPSADLTRSEHASALANLSVLRRRQGDLDDALRLAREAVSQDPGNSTAQFNLGVFLTAKGQRVEAETAYRQLLEREPGFAEAAVNLSGLLLSQGRAAEAVPVLRRALQARPAHAKCWKNLVAALELSGDRAGARAAAAAALEFGVVVGGVPEAPRH
jgi:tetratricopeptide (TPR) repeat protein